MLNVLKNLFLMFFLVFHISGCGPGYHSPHHEMYVVDGENMAENQTQTVALLKSDGFGDFYSFCSGVLLDSRHVLTAAHCHRGEVPVEDYRVSARTAFPNKSIQFSHSVARIDAHPEYLPKAMLRRGDGLFVPEKAGDIAIWTLASAVALEGMPELVIAPSLEPYLVDGQNFLVMGFGKKNQWESEWSKAQLARAFLPYFDQAEQTAVTTDDSTGRIIKKSEKVKVKGRSEYEVFLGGLGHPDTCKGDSGGPVFFQEPDEVRKTLILIAITSRGTSHCKGGGLYTLVTPYLSWIKDLTAKSP